ncbi:MAG: helix-turn-helix domain-containing protein [Clostridia bacterium]|nr:helix-turn-helix domain-containing protein [Clostridia bacterium]
MTETLGARICRLRTERGMSQGDLADRLGVSRQSVSKWETDTSTPDLERLVALAEVFGMTLDALILNKQEKPDEPEKADRPEKPHSLTENIPISEHVPQDSAVLMADGATTILEDTPSPKNKRYNGQRKAGIVLFAIAAAGMLVFLMMGFTGGSVLLGLLNGALFMSPLWIFGLILFYSRKHTAMKCLWTLTVMFHIACRILGAGSALPMQIFRVFFAVTAICTGYGFRHGTEKDTLQRNAVWTAVWGAGFVLFYFGFTKFWSYLVLHHTEMLIKYNAWLNPMMTVADAVYMVFLTLLAVGAARTVTCILAKKRASAANE